MLEKKLSGCLFSELPVKKLLDHIRSLFRRLLELRDTPHAVAGGAAIGAFFGFTPLFGVKTLLSLVTAWFARCSKIAAVIAVTLHDVVTPFWPVILRIEYDIGFWLLSHPHHMPSKLELHHVKLGQMLQSMLHWAVFVKVGLPLLIGSLVVAIPSAIVAYVLVYAILRKRHVGHLPPSG